ncbi:hypothetical protein HGRIS_011975 [Hohenbuehelia grisea]|uniref:Uncharacterized protein n=1 Tax=Hohenbuehelia grisea TaxID=104357 RepID=A0ABR3JXU5_9AGAR
MHAAVAPSKSGCLQKSARGNSDVSYNVGATQAMSEHLTRSNQTPSKVENGI